MGKIRLWIRHEIFLVLLAAFSMLAVAPAGQANKPSMATVSATPNPATVGAQVSLSGCGYDFRPVLLEIVRPDGSLEDFAAGMFASGCFGGSFAAGGVGGYAINVYYFKYVVGGFKKTSGVLASTALLVT